ncbi:MAG: hypothetical protein WED10_11480 [Brumimicrobium sp.]
MNKFFNIWILIFTVLTFPFALAVGLNVDFSILGLKIPGEEFEFKEILFGTSAAIIFLLGALKSSKRWSGIRVVKQKSRFLFSTEISKQRKNRVLLYNTIEIVFAILFAFIFWYFTESAIYISIVFIIIMLDYIANSIAGIGQKKYRVGMTRKAIVAVDREVKVIYFQGLKRITKHQQTLYFEYINDLVLHFPTNLIPESEQENFLKTLMENVSPDKVYYTGF